MSRKILYGNTTYVVGEEKIGNGKKKPEYGKVRRVYDENKKEFTLESNVENFKKKIENPNFYKEVKKYQENFMNGNYKNLFSKYNAIFSIGTGTMKNIALKKIELNKNGKYFQVQYISKKIKSKSEKQFRNNNRNITCSRKKIEEKINMEEFQEQLVIDDIKINVMKHESKEEYKENDTKGDSFVTYSILEVEEVNFYNEMICKMEEVNNKIVKFVEFINERSKEKKVRFSENILKVFIEQEIDEIIIKWNDLVRYVKKNNLVNSAKLLVKKERSEPFKDLFDCSENEIKENFSKIVLSILMDLNIRKKHCIAREEQWIHSNIDNDRHKSKFPTDELVKKYLNETTLTNEVFDSIFKSFKLSKFINEQINSQKGKKIIGETKIFKKFNEHYLDNFQKKFDSLAKENKETISTEIVRFIYRYIKGRIEKTVSTGSIAHWNEEIIKEKAKNALRNKILERILYRGKIKHTDLKEANVVSFQNNHAFEELLNEFYVFYSFFNTSIMEFQSKKNGKKEFYHYEYGTFNDNGNKHIQNFRFEELFEEKDMFDKSKKIIENLRNYLIHNNIPKLREIIDNKTAYLYYDKLEKIVEKIKISDLDRSKSLNLHIVLKGQNDKYKKIIHKLNEELQQNKEKENSTHFYPSLSKFITRLKSEISLPNDTSDENKEIILQGLVYLIKNIYKIDIVTKKFEIENIEVKYKNAQRKASQTQDSKIVKSFQTYVYSRFLEYLKKEYDGILDYQNTINIVDEIEKKSPFDESFELKTIQNDIKIENDIDYIIVIMGLMNNSRIVSQFMNRCISTSQWINNEEIKLTLLKISENLGILLKFQGLWNIEKLEKIVEIMNFEMDGVLTEKTYKMLPISDESKSMLKNYNLKYFNINKNCEYLVQLEFDKEKFKINNNPELIKGINNEIKSINSQIKIFYEKYKNNIIKYISMINSNKNEIILRQQKQELENTYIQNDMETIVFRRSILEAYHNNSFDGIDTILKEMSLDPITVLKIQSKPNIQEINKMTKWLIENRITGKSPIVKEIKLSTEKYKNSLESYKEAYNEYETYKFRRNIITYNIYNQLDEKLIDVQGKWLQWIARAERDLHYLIKGINEVLDNQLIEKYDDKKPAPISFKDGELNCENMHYKIKDTLKEDFLKHIATLGFNEIVNSYKKSRKDNIRNYIAHMYFLHEPFEKSISEITENLSNNMKYRSLYNSAVEHSILNIFKREVDIPIFQTKKNININNLDLIIKPKKNTQYMIEDTTERSKIIKKILEYKKS